jgi:hypothetical protein
VNTVEYRGLRYKLGRFGRAFYFDGVEWVKSNLPWNEVQKGWRQDNYHKAKRQEWKEREAERKRAARWKYND